MKESLEQLVARVTSGGFVPPTDPTASRGRKVMAQKIKMAKNKEFKFTAPSAVSKYPWDEWFNGDLLLLERSTGTEDDKGTITDIEEKRDYEVPTNSMPPKLKTAARRRYKVVQISRRDADGNKLADALIIRARDMTADERTAEDLLRAEEKAALKAKGEAAGDKDEAPNTLPTAQSA